MPSISFLLTINYIKLFKFVSSVQLDLGTQTTRCDQQMSMVSSSWSMLSLPLSSRNCLHTLTTRGQALPQEEPGTHCTSIVSDSESKDFILISDGSQGVIA